MTVIDIVDHIADRIVWYSYLGPWIAIDGPAGADTTYFADQLAVALENQHEQAAVRISVDDFPNTRVVRYRQGRDSPLGFWAESLELANRRRSRPCGIPGALLSRPSA